MQTITFYSYKGGVGRTLVLANVAYYLARFGQKVVALDLDLEAPGLHYKLLPRHQKEDQLPGGVVDYLDAFITEGQVPDNTEDYLVSIPLRESIAGQIHLMPAGRAPSAAYWHKLSRLDLHHLFYCDNAAGIPLFLELKERIRETYEPDFLLVDARTGITEIGGVATTVLPDQIVCLLLNNRENLDGARSVLRGLRHAPRPPGMSPSVSIVPVLSRIPSSEDADWDQGMIAAVRQHLNAPADRLEDTLELDEPLILHVDRQLEQKERVLIAAPKGLGESVLLKDYLRLFARLIPAGVLQPQVGAVIARAKEALFTDPDGAQRELENLAELSGRPEVYRELLRLYRVRNIEGSVVLSVAERLWDLTHDGREPLIYNAVRQYFGEVSIWHSTEWHSTESSSLSFVEDVWRANGADDVALGIELAKSFVNTDQPDRAAETVLKLAEKPEIDGKTIAQLIDILTRTKNLEAAQALVERFSPDHAGNIRFLTAWGRLVLRQEDRTVPKVLLSAWDEIAAEAPEVALGLTTRHGDQERSERLAFKLLEEALREGGLSESLEQAGVWFYSVGRGEEFRKRISGRLGSAEGFFLKRVKHLARMNSGLTDDI